MISAVVFLGGVVSPPSLMDDVDSTYAQIARTMLEDGDWVTARLNGVKYFDKPPGQVWAMAASFAVFGVSDWAARIPMALACIGLTWMTFVFGRWAFGAEAGFWAGAATATCVGLWLFSRVRIPDPALTLSITATLYAAMRLLEGDLRRPRAWALAMGAMAGLGVLFKGLPAVVFPAAAGLLFLACSGRLLEADTWRRLRPLSAAAALALVAAPWHLAAMVQNPPYFDWALRSEAGVYRGFFWRYFVNEHLLRYLGLRYPKDYDTVPRVWYWLMHLLWLFPWSPYLPAAALADYRGPDRASRVRLLALCWLAFVLAFFALSTSQEYYTMAAYPAFALLIGDAIARRGVWVSRGIKAVAAAATVALLAVVGLLILTAAVEPHGDIASSLDSNPEAYRLALGHMHDLTLDSFAWLRGPLLAAGAAFAIGAACCWLYSGSRALLGAVLMMVLFFQAARWALVSFDPYLSSRALAEAVSDPRGVLVFDDQYYSFSSLAFYTNRSVLLLGGRVNNIEYGSYAPGAPDVFLDDAQLADLWGGERLVYLATTAARVGPLRRLLGDPELRILTSSGGKVLLTNASDR